MPSSDESKPDATPRTSTAALLRQVREGDDSARDKLARRFMETLQRIAHGRLPHSARERYETDELVQETVLRGLKKVDGFEPRHEGAFLGYLRRILINLVYDEVRRAARRPGQIEIPESLPDSNPTPLTGAISQETREQYEAALAQLPEKDREAVQLRIEGHSYEEVAEQATLPSANAARMRVNRALERLAELMKAHRDDG